MDSEIKEAYRRQLLRWLAPALEVSKSGKMQNGTWAGILMYMDCALQDMESARDKTPSRELSLAITNLQQAIHWMEDIEVER